jgi:hypothetical protein
MNDSLGTYIVKTGLFNVAVRVALIHTQYNSLQ